MLEQTGIPTASEVNAVLPSPGRLTQGPIAIVECFQRIPCNPCADGCPQGAISIGPDINHCPILDVNKCNGCGVCLTVCPGIAIFVVDYTYDENHAMVKLPYEYSPLPEAGQMVRALNRQGEILGVVQVKRVQQTKNKTAVIWLVVPKALVMDVRGIAIIREGVQS